MLDRIIYRAKQFFFSMLAKMTESDKNFVRQNLNINEAAIFFSLPEFEQKHSVVVAHKMVAEGKGMHTVNEKKLIRLGLLHDIGKSAIKLSILDKSILVVINKLIHPLYSYLVKLGEDENAATIFRQFYVHKHHGAIGSRILKKIGESQDIVDEVAQHDMPVASHDVYMTILDKADSTY